MSFSGFVNAAVQLGLETVLMKPAKRGFYNITFPDGSSVAEIVAHCTVEELHTDELEITEHPIEQGAAIADHAFKHPAEVVLSLAWSNSPVQSGSLINAAIGAATTQSSVANSLANIVGAGQAAIGLLQQGQQNSSGVTPSNDAYAAILQLQAQRALFDLYTGRRVYQNMIIKSIGVQNDFKTEHALFAKITCRQVLLVNKQTADLSKDIQKNPKLTTSLKTAGTKQVSKFIPK